MSNEASPQVLRLQVAMPVQMERPLDTPLARQLVVAAFYNGLLKWTLKRVKHPEDAEDVLGVAIVRAIRRERHGVPWDPAGSMTAGLYMVRLLGDVLKNRKKYLNRNRADATEDMTEFASEDTSPGERAVRRIECDERRRLAERLHAELAESGEDPVVVAVLESILAGVTKNPDIEARTGLSTPEVLAAMARLRRYAQGTVEAFRQQARFQ